MGPSFPRVAAYLAGLPQGAASYPECEMKASGYRDAIARRPIAAWDALAEPLAQLLASPAPMSAWIPEAQGMALALAIADHHHMEDQEFLRFIFDHNRELLGSPTYSYLMRADGAQAMLKHAQVRWKAMHRGVQLEASEVDAHCCRYALSFPLRLYDPLLLKAFAQTFRAGLVLANLPEAAVELVEFTETAAVFVARW
jgi:hypothetical protein